MPKVNTKKTRQSTDEPASAQVGRRPRRGLSRFRLWEKKRGSHQTGSAWWGGAGEAIFFAFLFLTGVATLTQLIWLRVMVRAEYVSDFQLGAVAKHPVIGFVDRDWSYRRDLQRPRCRNVGGASRLDGKTSGRQ